MIPMSNTILRHGYPNISVIELSALDKHRCVINECIPLRDGLGTAQKGQRAQIQSASRKQVTPSILARLETPQTPFYSKGDLISTSYQSYPIIRFQCYSQRSLRSVRCTSLVSCFNHALQYPRCSDKTSSIPVFCSFQTLTTALTARLLTRFKRSPFTVSLPPKQAFAEPHHVSHFLSANNKTHSFSPLSRYREW